MVGGEAVTPGEFPWLAALKRDGKVICGATVVARDHLITATHCVHGYVTLSRGEVVLKKVFLKNVGFKFSENEAYPEEDSRFLNN